MLNRLELRRMAWQNIRDAQALQTTGRNWAGVYNNGGFAVELILKARICAAHGMPGYPETKAEFKNDPQFAAHTHLHLFVHDLEKLLALTGQAASLKSAHLNEWSACVQWRSEVRYQPVGSISHVTAETMLRSAEVVIRHLTSSPGLEAVAVPADADPYEKLWALEKELVLERGPFTLFVIWHRHGSFAESADVVVSAPWINAESRDGADYVSRRISEILTGPEVTKISGVIALDTNHPIVQAVVSSLETAPNAMGKFIDMTVNGMQIDAATVIAAHRDS